jgi:predicted NBD/HSP70 family sugar kinase
MASRPQLATMTGLSRATVAALATDLIASGTVEELGTVDEAGAPRSGRPAQLLAIHPLAALAVGVDIGHGHTRVMLCDARGEPLWDETVPQDVDHRPEDALSAAHDMVSSAISATPGGRERMLGIAIGIASPVDASQGTMSSASIMKEWTSLRPAEEFAARTGLPTRLVNDANAGALAEHLYGAARGWRDVVYVRLSAGIGAGILAGGRLLSGANGLAGELGHVQVYPSGHICRCGGRGCLETVASPVALAALLSESRHEQLGTTDLFRLLMEGDVGATRAVEDAGEAVGRCIGTLATLLDPELVVVGGELSAAGDALFLPMMRAVRHYRLPSRAPELRVVAGELGDSAAVRGAAGVVLATLPDALAQSASG